MSSADSYANQTEFDMDALRAETAIPPTVEYEVPLQALALFAIRHAGDGLARCIAVAVALRAETVVIARMEKYGSQVGPRFIVYFPFTEADALRLLTKEDLYDFDRRLADERFCKVIDGQPTGMALPWPWPEPAARPWWRFW